jgi:hypothetical protein
LLERLGKNVKKVKIFRDAWRAASCAFHFRMAHFFAPGRAKKPGQENARESASYNPRPHGPAR